MKTTLIQGKEVSKFDGEILQKLKTHTGDMNAVKKERMIVGIRNEQREIYRVIGITGLNVFLDAIGDLNSLDLIDELEAETHPKHGYDAIFSRGYPRSFR